MAAFAERLRLLRQARNITQARLADLLGINPRANNRWETADNVPVNAKGVDISVLANDLLRKDIELIQLAR